MGVRFYGGYAVSEGKENNKRDLFSEKQLEDLEKRLLPKSKINLTSPWGGLGPNQGTAFVGSKLDSDTQKHFLSARSKVHETWIIESNKTRRVSLIVSAVLVIAAAALLVFSPKEKEIISYGVAGAIVLLSSGIAGYGFLKIKTKNFSAESKKDSRENKT